MAIWGYARVSSYGQLIYGCSIEEQVQELKKYGCEKIVVEAHSAKTMDRPLFNKLIYEDIKEGDTLVVCKLDRFARSLVDGTTTLKYLFDKGVKVNILNMGIIEDTMMGRLILNLLLSINSYEREVILSRTLSAKQLLKSNPNSNFREGRPPKFTKLQIDYALKLLNEGHSYNEVAKITSISKSTLIRAHKAKQLLSENSI